LPGLRLNNLEINQDSHLEGRELIQLETPIHSPILPITHSRSLLRTLAIHPLKL
jgi:hypothetical protein